MNTPFRASPKYRRSKLIDRVMRGVMVLCTLAAIVPLVLIIGYVLVLGGSALTPSFFSQTYAPPLSIGADIPALVDPTLVDPSAPVDPNATVDPFANLDLGSLAGAEATATAPQATDDVTAVANVQAQGGVLHGIVGTLLVTGMALLISLPIGVLSGILLAEFRNNLVARVVRFCCDVLSGAPSIVVGVVAYVLIVQRYRSFSGLAGSIALATLMVPTITRTTEEMLRLVPDTNREAALALGAPTWYSTFTVIVPTALTGIVTGVMLAFARGAGETAPLLLTLGGNNNMAYNLLQPIAALPRLAYDYTNSPYPSENKLAWGTAFVLMVTVLLVNILVRAATASRMKQR